MRVAVEITLSQDEVIQLSQLVKITIGIRECARQQQRGRTDTLP